MKMIPTEAQEMMALFRWARLKRIDGVCIGDYMIHIPNGGSRHKLEAKNLKAQGVKAGVSDIFLAIPRWDYAGLWLEMKRRGGLGKVTDKQREWLTRMNLTGYKTHIACGWEQASECILDYLGDIDVKRP
jgi:hypothetical protein